MSFSYTNEFYSKTNSDYAVAINPKNKKIPFFCALTVMLAYSRGMTARAFKLTTPKIYVFRYGLPTHRHYKNHYFKPKPQGICF